MRAARGLLTVFPFAVFIGGLALATWRFRLHDPLGGLLFGEAGFLAFLTLAIVIDRRQRD